MKCTYPYDGIVAVSTLRSIELVVALLAEQVVVFFHKCLVLQRHVARGATEMFRMPSLANSTHERTTARKKQQK